MKNETKRYIYKPDEVEMLRQVLTDMHMDMTKFHAHDDKEIRFAKYGDDYLVYSHDHEKLRGAEYVTLEAAKALRDRDMLALRGIVVAFKARHDPKPLTTGEFYGIIDEVVKDFAKVRVYAASGSAAGSIQRRLKDLLRRIETP